MIVFDAGVLIAHLNRDDLFHEAATGFMEEYEEWEFVASVVTVAECLVHPAMMNGTARAVRSVVDLHLLEVDVTEEDIVPLAELRASTRMRMPDALVLHTARKVGGEIVTTDAALARAADARGVTAHLLTAP